MTVKELINTLQDYNKEAEVNVLAENKHQDFSISYGGGEGCSKQNCATVSLCVDALNQYESTG